MKKILCLLFAMLLIIGFAACSDEDGSKSSADEHDIIENKTYAGPATFSGSPEKMLILGISEKPMVGFVLTNDIAEVENYVFRGSETDEKKFVYAAKLPEDKSETAATANRIFRESCKIRPYDMSGNVIVYIQEGVVNNPRLKSQA